MKEEFEKKVKDYKGKMIKEYEQYLKWLFKDEKDYEYKQFIEEEIKRFSNTIDAKN